MVQSQDPPTFRYTVDWENGTNATTCGSSVDTPCIDVASVIRSFDLALGINGTDRTKVWFEVALVPGTYNGTGNLDNNLFGYANITFISTSSSSSLGVIFDAQVQGRPFKLVEPTALPVPYTNTTVTTVSFRGITFTNGQVSNTTLSYASGADRNVGGGGAFMMYVNNTGANVVFDTCTFHNNSARSTSAGHGGALRTGSGVPYQAPSNASLALLNCVFTDNSATVSGGAVHVESAVTTVTNGAFSRNHASNGSGGAIFIIADSAFVSNSNFVDNRAIMYGGAISLNSEYETTSQVATSNFSTNQAGFGGALAATNAYVNVTLSLFNLNNAMVSGGAVSVSNMGYFESVQSNFTKNNCVDGKGGAVRIEGDCEFYIHDSTLFQSNTANEGACISFSHSNGKINNTQFIDCNAYDDGGAIFTEFGIFSIANAVITNSSAQNGGAVYCSASKIDFYENVEIYDNVDIGSDSASDEPSGPGEIIPNSFNIYCGIDPPYTYCNFTGMDPFISMCGEPYIKEKQALTKGQLAGIIVGVILGAGVIAFGIGILITKTTIKSYFVPLIRSTNNGGEEDDEEEEDHHR
ncbi:pectin lyase-like family protein [Cavenderia fasciculata]|uniref:Pectin lyase-like family protein n=1 Tax=Cavenderia fasciculata TaxID=261658 RepID=F4PLM0_CACFS|nr:pectin lyase-like family protein [Cavenderia fasciculata]EGG23442.1 pectin lyase-like family protein [Cavenderia fasciculata]|eukprot:XP_004361293.1 pectin lyase-like family protein [Cavenderia fasciculata]